MLPSTARLVSAPVPLGLDHSVVPSDGRSARTVETSAEVPNTVVVTNSRPSTTAGTVELKPARTRCHSSPPVVGSEARSRVL